jgi:hypothetical protein
MRLYPSLLILGGCSASQEIGSKANAIRTDAQLLIDHGTTIQDPVVVGAATRIDASAASIHVLLPRVEDQVPAWLTTMQWGLIAVIAVAVIVFLWQTGLGNVVRIAIGWIPRKTQIDANLAADVLDESRPESAREYFAARRADPLFDAAFKKAKARVAKEKR